MIGTWARRSPRSDRAGSGGWAADPRLQRRRLRGLPAPAGGPRLPGAHGGRGSPVSLRRRDRTRRTRTGGRHAAVRRGPMTAAERTRAERPPARRCARGRCRSRRRPASRTRARNPAVQARIPAGRSRRSRPASLRPIRAAERAGMRGWDARCRQGRCRGAPARDGRRLGPQVSLLGRACSGPGAEADLPGTGAQPASAGCEVGCLPGHRRETS